MDKPRQRIPSFFKILLDDSANYLQLPSVFVNTNFSESEFPVNPVLKTESGGKWKVKIELIGGKYYFGKGWIEFVKDTKTEAGDFLVFRLIRNSNFQVSIFAPNCCEKDLSLVAPTTHMCPCNCRKCGNNIADLKTVIKREEDDDDEEEEEEEKGNEPSEWMVQSDNPLVQRVLKKSHFLFMHLPANFASGIEVRTVSSRRPSRKIMLRNQAGKEWDASIWRAKNGRICVTNGWRVFCKENRLMEGDTCSFQYFHGEGGQTSFVNFELLNKVPRKRGGPSLEKSMKRSG